MTIRKTGVCHCTTSHNPRALVTEVHHILPLSWGGPAANTNQVEVCAQTHYNVHFMLNEFVRSNSSRRLPGWQTYAYRLALSAWNQRIPDHPTPFWLPEPMVHAQGDVT